MMFVACSAGFDSRAMNDEPAARLLKEVETSANDGGRAAYT